ncbi:hypothetical protein [Halomonas sp. NO4]|uniref:hypothetical protein n=1 Tax=Halomonas sp. NO4 TaxID=2484813 RepID=UPI0013D68DB4|nr:hypothetical protein [Halomonas sp. NO4]
MTRQRPANPASLAASCGVEAVAGRGGKGMQGVSPRGYWFGYWFMTGVPAAMS